MSRDSSQQTPISYQNSSPESRTAENNRDTPTSPYSDRPNIEMATLPPPSHLQQQDPYAAHSNYAVYPPHAHTQIPYLHTQQTGATSSQPPSFPTQPAPRQRTAIACRYCRRRKIRCHGFDSSPDGRCTNCLRFNQECIFTPVSSQAHAFVPAHTAYPYLRNTRTVQTGPDGRPLSYPGQPGPPLYGAHGQPLGPVGQPPEQGYSTTPPQTVFNPTQYTPPPPPSIQYDEGNNRTTLPIRRGSSNYEYPDPRQMAPPSPASSAVSYQNTAYSPSGAQPYYNSTTPGDRRTSPTSSYFGPRPTDSPHGNNTHPVLLPPPSLHPPQVLPPSFDTGRNSSPSTSIPRTDGLPPPASATRSTTDNDMLNALTRHRR